MSCQQDWVYWDRNSLELTLELNPVMKPPAQEVAGVMWKHNLPALLRFIELVSGKCRGRPACYDSQFEGRHCIVPQSPVV